MKATAVVSSPIATPWRKPVVLASCVLAIFCLLCVIVAYLGPAQIEPSSLPPFVGRRPIVSRRYAFGAARVPRYKREGVDIPEWSVDTRRCDDLTDPTECSLSNGNAACFECVESRVSLRTCVHVPRDIIVTGVAPEAERSTVSADE